MTIGEDRVRIKFNPSDSSLVSQLKQRSAALIDLCEVHKRANMDRSGGTAEEHRLWEFAQSFYEEAAMWAVKAATIER